MNADREPCAEAALASVHERARAVTPEEMVRQDNGHGFQNGWHIGWAWGADESGRVFVDFLSEHRMTDMYADRFLANGIREAIEVPHTGYLLSGNPEEDAERKRQFFKRNQRVYADLRERGLLPPAGGNLLSQDINEYLVSGGEFE